MAEQIILANPRNWRLRVTANPQSIKKMLSALTNKKKAAIRAAAVERHSAALSSATGANDEDEGEEDGDAEARVPLASCALDLAMSVNDEFR
jgi:hypothetical protein